MFKSQITKADVRATAELQTMFPDLSGIVDDEVDLRRVKFIVILKNAQGEPLRVRLCQWNDPGVQTRREALIAKGNGTGMMADNWDEMLISAVDNMRPGDLARMMSR